MLIRHPSATGAVLPAPDADALASSQALAQRIADKIAASGGWMSFARFMELALYAPGYGYYAGGARKFGSAGDFVTAPELCAAFGQTLAGQAAQILSLCAPRVIEIGAGSGQLAVDLLLELESRQALPEIYAILELSGELRERQARTIADRAPQMMSRLRWLDGLPETFDGLVLANEVLDAMPTHLVGWQTTGIVERGVGVSNGEFVWRERPATGVLRQRAQALAEEYAIVPGYRSEIALAATAWISEWAARLGRGALLLIDYGFPRHEYYHPQRDSGTLMCHYRHHSHEQPFYLPGLQDITAHVDFTAIIESGSSAGLELLGYTSQAVFLFNCGLTEVLARTPADQPLRYLPLAGAVQKLVSPAEMGELFKVMALGKGIDQPLIGFVSGDRSMTL